jgi:aconitate hydratase
VFLRDIWPSEREIQETMLKAVRRDMFENSYAHVFDGDQRWRSLAVPTGERFNWEPDSTYIRNPPFFDGLTLEPAPPRDIQGARVLALLGDSVTTDHISPAGSIPADSPAGSDHRARRASARLQFRGRAPRQSRSDDVRGTFANIRLKKPACAGTEGVMDRAAPVRRRDDHLRRVGELIATRACRCS